MSEDIVSNILGSASAGAIARFLCHPIDTLKSRFQSGKIQFSHKTLYGAFKDTIRVEGFKVLYRGIGAAVLGGIPGVSLYLTSYEFFKEKLSAYPEVKNLQFLVYFSSGILAEAASCVVFVPVDVLKERLQVQTEITSTTSKSSNPYYYKNSRDGIRQILSQEGLRGLYKGYGATLLSYGPMSAIYFVFYENLKSVIQSNKGSMSSQLSFAEALSCAAAAGSVASFLSSPLDLAKLRLQIQRGSGQKTDSMSGMLAAIYRKDGLRGLFRGAGARVLFHTPTTALTISLFEYCKRQWSNILT